MPKRSRRLASVGQDEARRVKPGRLTHIGRRNAGASGFAGFRPFPLGVVLLILAGTLTYWNSLSGPFLFDDQRSIVENAQIRVLWPIAHVLRPPLETPVAGRPLVNLSFAINYASGELNVQGYHVFNLAVHLFCALTLFAVIRRTLESPKLAEKFRGRAEPIAWASALIWTLHPLQSEAVNYLTQRTESMMALFYLLTVYCSIRAVRPVGGGPGPQRGARAGVVNRWEAAAIASCLLGTACKESIVTAPLTVLLYDRVFLFGSFPQSFRARGRLYAGLAATWLALAAVMIEGPRASSVGFSNGVSAWTYLLNQAPVIAHYLRLAVWPRGLVLDYGLPQPVAIGQVLPSILLIVILLVVTVIGLVRRPFLGFLGAWFFITLAPSSSLVPISTEVGAERRMYLPMAAVVVFAVIIAHRLLNRLTSGLTARLKPQARQPDFILGFVLTAALCALLALGTIDRTREYESRLKMAQTIVERRPHGRAHFMLGTELLAQGGDRVEAMAHFRESARTYPGGHYALGTELIASGKADEGVQHLQEFMHLLPSHVNVIPAREMIGRVFLSQGKLDNAAEQFRLLLRTAPSFADAHGYLGDTLLAKGSLQDAIVEYQLFLRLRPASARAHANLGLALAKSGRLDEAIVEFRRSLEIDGSYAEAKNYLTYALQLKSERR